MDKRGLPLVRRVVYTEHFGLRVEPKLKEQIDELRGIGVDVSELARAALREAVKDAFKQLDKEAA